MNYVLAYYSRRGNTKKVAETIAQELGIQAFDVRANAPDVANADMLIIGSGTYGGKPGKEMVSFIQNLPVYSGKKAACFCTSAGGTEKAAETLRELLIGKGFSLVNGCFSCLGQWGWFSRRGHPAEDELKQARDWAKKLKP